MLLDEQGAAIGTASLLLSDMTTNQQLSPWLANIYIHPLQRGKGLGKQVVKQVMAEAHQRELRKLYLFTEDQQAFYRMKVKLKKEIVTLGVEVKPRDLVGHYLDPKEWNDLISRDDVILIDTRNDYEFKAGTFKGAIDPKTESFREFPEYVKQNLEQHKDKKIAMFCTGGIRCEKSTSLLLQEGFNEVYHLKGGILKYLEETPAEQSMWEGECFVFDGRTAVTHGVEEGLNIKCHACGWPLLPAEAEEPSYEHGVSCKYCIDNTTEKQKEGFRMRQSQIAAAKRKRL